MPTRFVILHHQLADGEHWDLMIEHGDVLLTWQLSRLPKGPDSFPIPASRIGDHRKAYLSYEGPISGGRGTVRRVAEGEVQIAAVVAGRIDFSLLHRDLAGEFVLSETRQGEWILMRH